MQALSVHFCLSLLIMGVLGAILIINIFINDIPREDVSRIKLLFLATPLWPIAMVVAVCVFAVQSYRTYLKPIKRQKDPGCIKEGPYR